MYKKIFSILTIAMITGLNAQVVIGGVTGSAGSNTTSVLLDFATGQKKGIIVPYVRTLPTGSNLVGGTILLDVEDATKARMRFFAGTDGWKNLSENADLTGANNPLTNQPDATAAPELATSRAIIGTVPDPIPANFPEGVLVLNSTTKAMVLPIVGTIVVGGKTTVDLPNPSPGMMVYVNTTGAKRLAVFNGKKWSFWKP